jgi:hypothetical protein
MWMNASLLQTLQKISFACRCEFTQNFAVTAVSDEYCTMQADSSEIRTANCLTRHATLSKRTRYSIYTEYLRSNAWCEATGSYHWSRNIQFPERQKRLNSTANRGVWCIQEHFDESYYDMGPEDWGHPCVLGTGWFRRLNTCLCFAIGHDERQYYSDVSLALIFTRHMESNIDYLALIQKSG